MAQHGPSWQAARFAWTPAAIKPGPPQTRARARAHLLREALPARDDTQPLGHARHHGRRAGARHLRQRAQARRVQPQHNVLRAAGAGGEVGAIAEY